RARVPLPLNRVLSSIERRRVPGPLRFSVRVRAYAWACHLPCSQHVRGRRPKLQPFSAPSPTRVAPLFPEPKSRSFWIALGPKSYGKFVSACHSRRKVMSTVEERRVVAIVDDEKPVCRAIGRLVMSAGFKSEIFSSAEEFLRSCRERRPDCLILDLSLPGMSGLELQQQLAADCCRTPIVVVSAHNDPVS